MLFLAVGMAIASLSYGQKDKLKEATKELEKATSSKEKPDEAAAAYQKAKDAIDAATTNPETKDNPKTWLTRAGIYIGMQDNAKLNADNPYREGVIAVKKAMELDKKLESDQQVINLVANGAFFSFNDGINTYNNSKYGEAYNLFKQATEILGPDKDKRFILMPIIDTIRAQSKMFMGYTAFYDNKFDEAITDLNASKNSPYLQKNADIYIVLAQAYEKKGDKANQLAVIKEGKQKFPDDKNLSAQEINYALSSGNQSDAISKMEENIAKDPSNPEMHLQLGILYNTLAHPTGGAAPANAKEYYTKAEGAYKKAVELEPNSGSYNYQLGAFYFNQGADINNNMNNLGTGKEDQKKYNELLKQRDALFAQSVPYLEKSKEIFKAKGNKLKGEEGKFYFDTLGALKEIYNRTDQTEKAAEVKKLLAEISQ